MSDSPEPPLTPSEELLLDCIRRGMHDAEIAVRIGVSTGEAKERIEALARKLGLPSRASLGTWPDTTDVAPEGGGQEAPVNRPSSRRAILPRLVTAALAVAGLAVVVSWTAFEKSGNNGDFRTVTGVAADAPVVDGTVVARLRSVAVDVTVVPGEYIRFLSPAILVVSCIEIRSIASDVRIACVAPGARLRSLRDSRIVEGTTWEKVEAPGGEVGWIDARYLR